MLYDASRVGNATPAVFDSAAWLAQGAAKPTPGGRGAALFIGRDGREWVLRHYRRGGAMAKFSRDRYFWTGEARTRPFREWQLLKDMHDAGLPVPAPVAAMYIRTGLSYTGDLITERIPDARPLSSLLEREPQAQAVYEAVGRCIRAFHKAGIYHADLNAHNVLLDTAGRVFLIDFDRGRKRAPGRWREENLRRLHRSLIKVTRQLPAGRFSSSDWDALMRGYRP